MTVNQLDGVPSNAIQPTAIKSSVRTLEILELLSRDSARRTVSQLSRDLRIPKSSLHGLLRTMKQRGWLETDETGTLFGLGLRALIAGNAYIEADDLVAATQPHIDALGDLTGETIHLGRLDESEIVYLAKKESRHALRLFSAVGRRLPAHATALGKAILAQMSDLEADATLAWPLQSLTPTTITDRGRLHEELASIRVSGVAVDSGENSPGIRCIAVALASPQGVHNAISCSIPLSRMSPAREVDIIRGLCDTAQSLNTWILRTSS